MWNENKVYIAYLWAQMRLDANRRGDDDFYSLAGFKRRLVDAMRAGLVRVARNDLPQAAVNEGIADRSMIERSITEYLEGMYHFVVVD